MIFTSFVKYLQLHLITLLMDSKKTLTPMETHWSSDPDGNFTTNLDPAFSSDVFKGLNLQTTRILSSDGPSFSWSPPGFDILNSFFLPKPCFYFNNLQFPNSTFATTDGSEKYFTLHYNRIWHTLSKSKVLNFYIWKLDLRHLGSGPTFPIICPAE